MNNLDIKYVSELYEKGRVKSILLVDGTAYSDSLQHNAIIFDQDNLICYAFGLNNSVGGSVGQNHNPYKLTAFKYSDIVSITVVADDKCLESVISKLEDDGIIDDTKSKELRDTMKIEKLIK